MGGFLKKLLKKSVGLDPVTKKVAQATKKVDPLARGALKADKLTQRVNSKVLGQNKRSSTTTPVKPNLPVRPAGKAGKPSRKGMLDY